MKRRFKLITSIASLTAAVALTVAGVYAAAIRQVDITGSVSFTAQNVDATVVVEEGSALTEGAIVLAQVGTDVVFVSNPAVQTPVNGDVALGLEALDDDTLVYQYQISITNNSAKVLFYVITVNEGTFPAGVATDVTETDAVADYVAGELDGEIAAGNTVTLTVTYTVTPSQVTTASFAAVNFGANVDLATTNQA